jgi:hypothetical protein
LTVNHYRLILVAVVAVAVMGPATYLAVRELRAVGSVRPAAEDRYPPLEAALSRGVIDRYRATEPSRGAASWSVDGGELLVVASAPRGSDGTVRVFYEPEARAEAVAVRRLIRDYDRRPISIEPIGAPG